MGTIETKLDQSQDLTIAKARGKMTADDFRKWRLSYYSGTVTRDILWDLIEADFSGIASNDIQEHAKRIKENVSDVREGGKTAIYVDENYLALGLCRMREIYGEMEDTPIEIRTFTDMDEAMEWLGIKDS